jgi:HAD superfamily hydrolase (TIGR01509 family)
MIRAVLIDVGGTLWPDAWLRESGDQRECVRRLREATPGLSQAEASRLVDILGHADHPVADRQQTAALVSDAIARVGPGTPIRLEGVRAAMSLPARGRVHLFPGAQELLAGLEDRGIRVVIASNVLWRDASDYRRDFRDLGVAHHVAAFVSSIDVGWRKPHPAFFAAALSAADHPAGECVMVGDSERNDITPARALGMLTIRVAIEQPLAPATAATAATHICRSLAQVAEVLFAEADGSSRSRRPAAG